MKYPRPKFGEGPSVDIKIVFGNMNVTLPKFDYPITPKENYYRALRRENPMWVPFAPLEVQEMHMFHLAMNGPEGTQLGPPMADPRDRYTYTDHFGNHWTYDKNAGGACMTPGTRICDDILKWEEQIPWPDLHEWHLEERAKKFMEEEYDPAKILHIDIYHGPFQSLADFMGGFAEALEAMFVEPEASRAFFDRFADWYIWLIDKLSSLYPVDIFTIHDDWGTAKDAFFSPAMMEELLFEPTKKVIDHVHSLGKLYTFHCCGKIEKFMPAFARLGPNLTQIQRNLNDLPAIKKEFGNKFGFNAPLEGLVRGKKYTEEELAQIVRDSVDIYAPGGGWSPGIHGIAPKDMWDIAAELYAYSREFYENNQ